MKKFFEQAKEKFLKADDDDKAAMIFFAVIGLFIALLLVALAWLIVESMLPYLIGAAVLYALGVKFMSWPIPKFVKKLFK